MKKEIHDALAECEQGLKASFQRWEYLMEHGCMDPTWPDGVNLNLVRNHIISYKRQIDQLLAEDDQSLTLFQSTYPDIYYRETPDKVSDNLMVKADEIRAHAKEQLALYEQDPNFCYIRDNAHLLFPKGETKATRAAGLYPSITSGLIWYRKIVENDDLVAMRSRFYRPYDEKAPEWANLAGRLKTFLETDHSMEEDGPIQDEDDFCESYSEEAKELAPEAKRTSLDEQIRSANVKTSTPVSKRDKEEQLSFF